MRLLFFISFVFGTVASAAPPNVLFIAVDDLRPELGCYGENHMVTPNMDTLAAQGRMFRNHYVAVPTCGASRYALMTGLRPLSSTDNNDAFNQMPTSLPADPESWVDLLRRNGWHTACLGKLTHEPDGYRWVDPGSYDSGRSEATFPDMRFSWDEIIYDHDKWGAQWYPLFAYADGTGRVKVTTPAWEIGVDELGNSLPDDAYPDGQMANAAIEKLREYSDDNQRFCLAVGFHKPHLPFNRPRPTGISTIQPPCLVRSQLGVRLVPTRQRPQTRVKSAATRNVPIGTSCVMPTSLASLMLTRKLGKFSRNWMPWDSPTTPSWCFGEIMAGASTTMD
jgi:hypothetical protein